MNTIKITKTPSGYLELHLVGRGLIPIYEYGPTQYKELVENALEWCSRKPKEVASTKDPAAPTCEECVDTNLHLITEGPDKGFYRCAGSCAIHAPLEAQPPKEEPAPTIQEPNGDWFWMAKWCRQRGVSPWDHHNWNRAKEAWEQSGSPKTTA